MPDLELSGQNFQVDRVIVTSTAEIFSVPARARSRPALGGEREIKIP